MGAAPVHQQENRGLDDKQINLSVVQPGERPAIFGDALRRLGNQARFMHTDLGRYWYSMSASLNRIAADRAGQLEEALVRIEIDKALEVYINGLGDRGHFDAVQVLRGGSGDVPDEAGGVRAVVLGVEHPHTGRDGSGALTEAEDVLLQRGSSPRVYRNVLVFLAAEARQLDNLQDAMRSVLAWEGIVRDTERLNLTQSDSALAKAKLTETKETLGARLRETWCYLLYTIPERSPPSKDGRDTDDPKPPAPPDVEAKPTRFAGTVMVSADRPVREIHRIVEGVVEQLTTLPGSEVSLKLEIDAEVPAGLDRAKVRTLIENANTLGFIEKSIK